MTTPLHAPAFVHPVEPERLHNVSDDIDPRREDPSLRRRYGRERGMLDLYDLDQEPPGWAEP